ncbi:MAG: PD-(D/E)XK nuclease family protein [Thermoanaerobaculum sp.]
MEKARCVVVGSPREAVALLASELSRLATRGSGLRRRAVVVVPSRSVREGLAHALVTLRPGWVGVEIRTLHGAALAILQKTGAVPVSRDALLPIVTSRLARELARWEPTLQVVAPLARVSSLAGTVRDLLDAGLTAAHLDAVEDLFAAEVGEALGSRAVAVARLAVAAGEVMAEVGAWRRSDILKAATETVHARGREVVPWDAVFCYGFADVTGVAGDFLEALLKASQGQALVVAPPDPVVPGQAAGGAFLDRLRRRLSWVKTEEARGGPALPQMAVFRAPELEAEVRWVAEAIRRQLVAGVAPERIGVVARDLAPYACAIRQHFAALGVPFSALAPSPVATPQEFRLQAVLDLFERGSHAPIATLVRALPASARVIDEGLHMAPSRLQVQIHVQDRVVWEGDVGAPRHLRRFRTVAGELQRAAGRVGAHTVGQLGERRRELEGVDEPGSVWERPIVPERLAALLEGLAVFFTELPERAPGERFAREADELASLLGLSEEDKGALAAAAGEAARVGGELTLAREEWCYLAKEALTQNLAPPLGGVGGGVAVLSAMEARFRTFDCLYLLGLQRDVFPGVPREDPLLPDSVRRKLEVLLPDIPLGERAAFEERYLFGLLLVSAPSVFLLWPAFDPDGRPLARSPFLDELLAAHPELQEQPLPGRWALHAGATPRLAPASEWAVAAGLAQEKRLWREAFALALNTSLPVTGSAPAPEEVAEVRWRLLEEWSPPPGEAQALSPFLGFVGNAPWVGARESPLTAITAMELYAQCPWKAFLERVLRLEPNASTGRPGAELRPELLGSLVHRVLEKVLSAHHEELRAMRRRGEPTEGVPVVWPHGREEALARGAAVELLRFPGALYPGLVEALVAAALPYLEVARDVITDPRTGSFTSGEGEGRRWTQADGPRWFFRFDAFGSFQGFDTFYDFKTGNPARYFQGKSNLLGRVRRGELLQGAMYAMGGHLGRYVFLDPSWDGERILDVPYSHELAEALWETLDSFMAAARLGVFFPRLFDPQERREPHACQRCDVRLACSRGESAARRRLELWGDRERGEDALSKVALDHWWLGRERERN